MTRTLLCSHEFDVCARDLEAEELCLRPRLEAEELCLRPGLEAEELCLRPGLEAEEFGLRSGPEAEKLAVVMCSAIVSKIGGSWSNTLREYDIEPLVRPRRLSR